jgi:hypothetical protein
MGVALALGRHSVVYDLVSSVPPQSLLRYPVKVMLAASLGWSLLAGLGLDAIRRGDRRARIGAGLALASLALAGLGLAGALIAGSFDASLAPGVGLTAREVTQSLGRRLGAGAGLAVLGGLACALGSRRAGHLAAALGLLCGGELVWHHQRLHSTAP